jgi:hypothetical protein
VRRVDPTIAAAWITGGVGALGIMGTVTATVVGSRNTKRATEATIAAGAATTTATLAAAREDRLWEKRCAAYETMLEALLYRQRKREHDLRMYRLDEDSEEKLREFFDSYQAPGWFQARARLTAYASDPVLAAFEASEQAHHEVWACYQRYRMMADDNKRAVETGQFGAAHGGQETIDARKAVHPAVEEAEVQDQALIKLIRDELRSIPEAARLSLAQPG